MVRGTVVEHKLCSMLRDAGYAEPKSTLVQRVRAVRRVPERSGTLPFGGCGYGMGLDDNPFRTRGHVTLQTHHRQGKGGDRDPV